MERRWEVTQTPLGISSNSWVEHQSEWRLLRWFDGLELHRVLASGCLREASILAPVPRRGEVGREK